MKITFARDEADFDLIAAWRIIGQILQKHDSVIELTNLPREYSGSCYSMILHEIAGKGMCRLLSFNCTRIVRYSLMPPHL